MGPAPNVALRFPRVDTDRQATDFGDHKQAVAGNIEGDVLNEKELQQGCALCRSELRAGNRA
jgi:hypothetical protein